MFFATPGFEDGGYPDNYECTYKFYAEDEDLRVKLQFLSFDVESCPDCSCDILEVVQ